MNLCLFKEKEKQVFVRVKLKARCKANKVHCDTTDEQQIQEREGY